MNQGRRGNQGAGTSVELLRPSYNCGQYLGHTACRRWKIEDEKIDRVIHQGHGVDWTPHKVSQPHAGTIATDSAVWGQHDTLG